MCQQFENLFPSWEYAHMDIQWNIHVVVTNFSDFHFKLSAYLA